MREATHNSILSEYDIELIRSRRRTLTLEVGIKGIRVRAPMRLPSSEIESFVRSKVDWLNKQLAQQPPTLENLKLQDGDTLFWRGEPLILTTASQSGSVEVRTVEGVKQLFVPFRKSRLPSQETVRRKIVAWYKTQARNELEQQIKQLITIMEPDALAPNLKVREYKRRWGSCSADGSLSFNWRIIQAPVEILRYVVVHELAHRQEFNHSKKFWGIVAVFDARWREHQAWLNRHGHELYRF